MTPAQAAAKETNPHGAKSYIDFLSPGLSYTTACAGDGLYPPVIAVFRWLGHYVTCADGCYRRCGAGAGYSYPDRLSSEKTSGKIDHAL